MEKTLLKNEKRASLELARADLFQILVSSVQDYAIFLLDVNGNIASWNRGAERIKGFEAEEIIGKHFSIFYPEEDIRSGKPANELNVALREGRVEDEGWRIRKNGERFWANVVITALRDNSGHHIGFAKVTRDMTERKMVEAALIKANEELEAQVADRTKKLIQTNKELEQFASTASHDLKEPLRKIMIYSDKLAESVKSPDENNESYLYKIQEASRRMFRLIDDLLDYAHTVNETKSDGEIDLGHAIEDLLKDFEHCVLQKNFKIEIDELPIVRANPLHIRQVFHNLLSNAFKYSSNTDRRPEIKISSRRVGDFHEIIVKDNGTGFDPQYKDRIFEPFKRLHNRKEYEGTGLGLAICRKIIQSYGGNITAQSQPGEGSEFTVTLPVS